MKRLVTGLLAVALGSTVSATAYAQKIKLGEVLVVHVLEMKPDVDTRAFETFVVTEVAPAWEKHAPGLQLSLIRADRGSREGQYVLLSTTDTEERHQGYGSTTGNSPFSPELRARMAEFWPGFEAFVNSVAQTLEYHLLDPRTAGALPEVDSLGIHSVNVLPDRREAFERFVAEKLHPAVANLRPDLRLLYYKSVRGQDAGNYILVFALTKPIARQVLARRIRFRRLEGGVRAAEGDRAGTEHLSGRRFVHHGREVRGRNIRQPGVDGFRACI